MTDTPRPRPSRPPIALRLLRVWFAVTSRVAPPLAEWHAARLFLTPRPFPRRPVPPGSVPRTPLAADVAGFRLVGWECGTGPTVLLVHGWSGRADDMAPIADALAGAGFRAVVFDMPAHGASPGVRTSMAEWMELMPPLAERLGGVHAVVAHSFGGAASTLALEAGLPVNGIVLLASPVGPAHFMARMRELIGLPASRAAGMERRLVARIGRPVEFFDTSRAARSLDLPALIIHDRADREVPYAHAEIIAGAWRGSTLVPMSGVGHTRLLAVPDVVRRVVEWIAAVPAGSGQSVRRSASGGTSLSRQGTDR